MEKSNRFLQIAPGHIDLADESETGEVDDNSASEWINVNAFTACMMQKGLIRFSVLAILEIRNALEEEPPAAGPMREYRLSVATQWLLIFGTKIFKDAFQGNALSETELRATAPDQLYIASGGEPGLSGIGKKTGFLAKQAARHMEEIMEQDGRVVARRLGTGNGAEGGKPGIDAWGN
ncbi:hypothetical protein ACO1O0_007899 [Amphichorda felina]